MDKDMEEMDKDMEDMKRFMQDIDKDIGDKNSEGKTVRPLDHGHSKPPVEE